MRDSFRDAAEAEGDWLHRLNRLLSRGGNALIDQQPVAGAKLMVAVLVAEFEEARRGALRAHRNGRVADLYAEFITCLLLRNVLNRVAHAYGQAGRAPWEALLPVAEASWADEQRAREMLRVGFEGLRQAPEAWTALYRVILEEPGMPSGERDRAAAALIGLVDARHGSSEATDLHIAMKRGEGEDFLDWVTLEVMEAVHQWQQGVGLDALRSNAINAMRRRFERRQHEFETRRWAEGGEQNPEDRPEETELAAFAERERRMQLYGSENRKMAEAKLSPNQRQVLVMRRTLKDKEISERTGRSPEQIRKELHEARKKRRGVG